MVKRRRANQKTRPRKKTKLRRAGRRDGRGNFTSSIGTVIAKGVRAVISQLPMASSILGIADMIFGAFGVGSITSSKDGKRIAVQKVFGLSGSLFVSPVNCVASSPIVAKEVYGFGSSAMKSNLHEYKLTSFTARARPAAPILGRRARWGIAIVPIRTEDDREKYLSITQFFDLRRIMQIPGAKIDTADRMISASYSPIPEDGVAYQYNAMNDTILMVLVVYENDLREQYTELTVEEFSPDISISAIGRLRQPNVNSDMQSFMDVCNQPKLKYSSAVYDTKTRSMMLYNMPTTYVPGSEASRSADYPGCLYVSGISDYTVIPKPKKAALTSSESQLTDDYEMLHIV